MEKQRVKVDCVSKRKKKSEPEIPNPLRVNEEEFTDVIRKMVNTPPQPLRKLRKNPETDPRYLPVFDLSRTIRIEHPKQTKKKD